MAAGANPGVSLECARLPGDLVPADAEAAAWPLAGDRALVVWRTTDGRASGLGIWRRRQGSWVRLLERRRPAFIQYAISLGDVTGDGRTDVLATETSGGSGGCGQRVAFRVEADRAARLFSRYACETASELRDGLLLFREPIGACPFRRPTAHCYGGVRLTIRGWSGPRVVVDRTIVRCLRSGLQPNRRCQRREEVHPRPVTARHNARSACMTRVLVIAFLLSVLVGADALACSCAGRDARSALAASNTAFTAIVESRREEHPNPGSQSSMDPAIYVVRVERELKGDLPERVELTTASSGASCGLENKVGDRVGFALSDQPAPRMKANLCQTADPDELIAAAAPFPQPRDGTGVRYLVPMALGNAGLGAYDAAGRLRAYGFGVKGMTLAACPGGKTVLAAGDELQVLRLRDLRVLSTKPLPGDDTSAVRCLSADGATAAAMTFDYGPTSAASRLVRVERGRVRTLRRTRSDAVALTQRGAVIVTDRDDRWSAIAVDLDSGAVRRLARGAGGPYGVAARADGRRVAVVHGLDGRSTGTRSGITVLDPGRAGKVVTTHVAVGAESARPVYLGDRLALVGHKRGTLLDARLRRVATLPAADGGYVQGAGSKILVAREGFEGSDLLLAAPGAKRLQRLAQLPVPPRGLPLTLAAPLTLEGHSTDAARPEARTSARQARRPARCAKGKRASWTWLPAPWTAA